jgi:hypothetical protein
MFVPVKAFAGSVERPEGTPHFHSDSESSEVPDVQPSVNGSVSKLVQ